ncbi:uroporphyrinogen decarboxylase family protein [Chloroflexota bacterium]
MSKWERIRGALGGAPVDRVPLSLWKHYYLQEWGPGQLAHLTLALHRDLDTDLIKLTPSGSYFIQGWGPTIRFSTDDNTPSVLVKPTVASADGWTTLPRLDVTKGALGRELETIHQVATGLDGTAPLVMTIYSPLSIASMLCWNSSSQDSRGMIDDSQSRVVQDLRQSPRQLHRGLATIRDVVMDYVDVCLEAGASGLFFATRLARYDALTRAEYEQFGAAYDLAILERLVHRSQITMLHVCKQNLMFDLMIDYPVDVISWADRDGGPTLAEAREMTDKALAGGLSVEALLNRTETDVLFQARDAIAQTKGVGFILAPGCVIEGPTPDANLLAVRQAIAESASP